jgi:putative membrane protein
MMNNWNGAMTWEGWFFMSIFWVLLLGVIVWAAAQLFPARRTPGGRETGEEPRAILDRRLATGEIDVETYEQLRRTLGAAGGVS